MRTSLDKLEFGWLSSTWAQVLGGPMATRETIVSSGGSTAVNNAITALAALGGGVVRLDGIIDMDGDINMASNVYLMGYGPGTGLRNNTASNYEVNFVGTGTSYGIAAPTNGADNFTTDTAGDATNFVAGGSALIVDGTGSPRECQLVYIKTSGVGATGKVEIYDDFDSLSSYGWNAATVAYALTPVRDAGLFFMELVASSTGSLIVDADYAHDILFESVKFDEVRATIDYSGNIKFSNCKMLCQNVLNFTNFIGLGDYVDGVYIERCYLSGALSGVEWTGSTHLRNLHIQNTRISGCQYPLNLTPGTTTDALAYKLSLRDSNIDDVESPASGGGSSNGIYTTGWIVNFIIDSNVFKISTGNTISATSLSNTKKNHGWNINNNNFIMSSQNIFAILGMSTFNNNYFAGAVQVSNGVTDVTFVGNYVGGAFYFQNNNTEGVERCVINGNKIAGTAYINSNATKPAIENSICGNSFDNILSITEDGTDNVISGNFIDGNVTIGGGAGDVNDRNIFSNNNVDGTVTFTEANQDYCVVVGNTTNGAITDLLAGGGAGNIQANNTVY
jgi:hypothetical protein